TKSKRLNVTSYLSFAHTIVTPCSDFMTVKTCSKRVNSERSGYMEQALCATSRCHIMCHITSLMNWQGNGEYDMAVIQTPKVLPVKEVISMRPQDREHYIEKIMLKILEMNPRGVTIPEIASRTGFYRDTVGKHLDKLVATREGYRVVRGNVSVYYKNGQ